MITNSLPQVQWENPVWGVLREQTWAMEINFDEEGPVESFMLHVRGSGDPHITVAKLCRDNGWVAFDMTTGEHLDLANPSDAGWRSFLGVHQKVARRVKWEEKLEEYRLLIFAIIVGFVIALYRFFK